MEIGNDDWTEPRRMIDYPVDRFEPKLGRAVGGPQIDLTLRGPRESFVESLGTNIALLRRRIDHPDLMIETRRIGRKTGTTVALVYLRGVINEKIPAELRLRLNRIDIDGILGAGYIEQLISDAPHSPFSTTSYSERTDVAAARILEGRAAILIDGSPEVLTILFVEGFQSPDD